MAGVRINPGQHRGEGRRARGGGGRHSARGASSGWASTAAPCSATCARWRSGTPPAPWWNRPSASAPASRTWASRHLKVSVKSSSPLVTIDANRRLAETLPVSAAPRRDRGRDAVDGLHPQRGGAGGPAGRGGRRHHPGLAHRRSGGGGEGRPGDPAHPGAAPGGPRVISCPTCGRTRGRARSRWRWRWSGGCEELGPTSRSPSWGASSTGRARRARPISASPGDAGEGVVFAHGQPDPEGAAGPAGRRALRRDRRVARARGRGSARRMRRGASQAACAGGAIARARPTCRART